MADRNRATAPAVPPFGAVLLALALAAAPARGQDVESLRAADALVHAQQIEAAWYRLEQHIRFDSTAATTWFATPPTSVGWRDDWTDRGLSARYCDGVLVVYADSENLRGVGEDQRAVRLAPHKQHQGVGVSPPPLHWLEGAQARGGLGRPDVAVPTCMSLPEGRVALAGNVADPFATLTERVSREREDRACPAGSHGPGRRFVREVVQDVDGRGRPAGDPRPGAWELLADGCTRDYQEWVHFTEDAEFWAGDPHNAMLPCQNVFRRLKTVTADGEMFGDPVPVSSSCWDTPEIPPAEPTITLTVRAETRQAVCPEGFEGTMTEAREVSRRLAQFPWDDEPTVVESEATEWIADPSTCAEIPPEPEEEADAEEREEDAEEETEEVTCRWVGGGERNGPRRRVCHNEAGQVVPGPPLEPECRMEGQGDRGGQVLVCSQPGGGSSSGAGGGNRMGVDVDGDGVADFSSHAAAAAHGHSTTPDNEVGISGSVSNDPNRDGNGGNSGGPAAGSSGGGTSGVGDGPP